MAYSQPTPLTTPLLAPSTSSSGSSGSGSDSEDGRPTPRGRPCGPYRLLAVLRGHAGPVACLALCGEFVLSASHGRDILAWQQPDMRPFGRFGRGDGSVKALVALSSRLFTAHQDGRLRVWALSRRSSTAFRLAATLPTPADYLANFASKKNYVPARRHRRRRLWIEHADTISCLAAAAGLVYSGSWDKTLKVWRVSDLRCLESIKAHDDAINALAASHGALYSASADGKIKIWMKDKSLHRLKSVLEGPKDVSWNAVIVLGDGGRYVYGGGSDGRVMGWEAETIGGGDTWNYKLVCDLKAHEMSVLCLCSTGEYLCSGSADKSIGVWRREACGGGLGRVGIIRGHEGPVKCLQATSYSVGNGFLLYSGGLDKYLRVWWVATSCKEEEDEQTQGMGKFVLLR